MILKYLALIVIFLIAILQGIFADKINEKKWSKGTLIGLLIASLFIGLFILKRILLQGIQQYQWLERIFFFDSLLCSDHILWF